MHSHNKTGLDVGSFKDHNHEWKPSYMRTMPSLSLQDQYHRQNARKLDLTGDMIFGTAPLAYKGMNTKVHYYKRDKDPQIVISKLFTLNNTSNNQHFMTDGIRRTSFSSVNSDRSTASFMAHSYSCEDNISEISSDDDRYSTSSIYPPVLGLKSKHKSSKRNRRFSQTYMENGIFTPTPLPSTRLLSSENPLRQASRSVKYAVAVIITLEDKNETLYDFIFSHFALIENRLHQLQSVAFRQLYQHKTHSTPQLQHRKRNNTFYLHPNAFQHDGILIEAVSIFKKSLFDLYETPRIQEPLWLNMSTFPQHKSRYEKSMMTELIDLIQNYDNKAHNYFISTLITAVLMHHLSWVHTVAPSDDDLPIGCHHGNYDPLWAQLSDLYGFIGTPSRITRTIVVGSKVNIVRRILYILSYFIRCNEVYENTESRTSAESIFYHELNDNNNDKFEDKIVRHLTGDVESIAIPNTNHTATSIPNHHLHYPSSSVESTNSFKSQSKWYSDAEERPWSPDPSSPPSHSVDMSTSPTGSYRVPMPKSTIIHMEPDITQSSDEEGNPNHTRIDRLYAKSYGRSLMASYCDTYKADFVLMGIPTLPSNEVLISDLKTTLEQFNLTDAVPEASCLVIDTNDFQCRVLTHQLSDCNDSNKKINPWKPVSMSHLVHKMLNEIRQMFESNVGIAGSEELIHHMEDSLQLIYLFSTMLQDIIQTSLQINPSKSPLADTTYLATQLNLHTNDIPLLLNVCSTYDSKIWELQKEASSFKHKE